MQRGARTGQQIHNNQEDTKNEKDADSVNALVSENRPTATDQRSLVNARIERCSGKDAQTLSSWYHLLGDKHLPYSNVLWSEWWERRCSLNDHGCEMIKLVVNCPFTGKCDVIGIAYYERNIPDRHLHQGNSMRVTLVRGIRISPVINKEVLRRMRLDRDASLGIPEYSGVATVLLNHIVMRSLLFGTQGVAVHSIKSDIGEAFYARHLGNPVAFNEEDGRKYFRFVHNDRFNIIVDQFKRQCSLLGHQTTDSSCRDTNSHHNMNDTIRNIKSPNSSNNGSCTQQEYETTQHTNTQATKENVQSEQEENGRNPVDSKVNDGSAQDPTPDIEINNENMPVHKSVHVLANTSSLLAVSQSQISSRKDDSQSLSPSSSDRALVSVST